MKSIQIIVAGVILFAGQAFADPVTKDYTFGSGDPVSSSKINTNFDELYTEINAKETRMSTLETNTLHWDGSSTDLTAATGRTSLGLGTAATLSVGSGANNVVQLDGSAKLPSGLAGAQRVATDSNDYLVWALDEAADATTIVNSGTAGVSGDLALLGSPSLGRFGLFGKGLNIPGTGRDGATGASAANPSATTITISAWVKKIRYYESNWGSGITKDYRGDNSWSSPWVSVGMWFQNHSADGAWYAAFSVGGTSYGLTADTADQLTLNEWHHLGFTYDSSGIWILYKDGVEVKRRTDISGSIDYGDNGPWDIGGHSQTSWSGQMGPTLVDDVRIANVVRPASWFANVYKSGMQQGF